MKKYIVMSIIAVVALLPFAAWADEGGSATATLKFNAVINTKVTDNWAGIEVDQKAGGGGDFNIPGLAALTAGIPIAWSSVDPEITVKVEALTNFMVWGAYDMTKGGSDAESYLTTSASFLYLNDGTQYALPYDNTITVPAHGLNNTSAAAAGLVDLSWTGTPNLPSGASVDYNVEWDPSELYGADLKATDTFDLTIYFVVTDSAT